MSMEMWPLSYPTTWILLKKRWGWGFPRKRRNSPRLQWLVVGRKERRANPL